MAMVFQPVPEYDNTEFIMNKDNEMVTIQINGTSYQITKGNHSTEELKRLASVPLADDLDEVKNNKPHPLQDDGHTNINGGEVFVSHPKGSGSSSE
jgi:hypothetical protein